MSILHAVILGAAQGLTEFLPVSSSGHLVLLQKIFGIEDKALAFDVMVHVGTLLAVFVVLWRDIWAILHRLIQPLTGWLVLATVPAVIAAIVFRKPIERAFESGQFLGFSFLLTAGLLCAAELLARRAKSLKKAENMNWPDALFIGVLQAVAIAPGVSRSGATISGALARKLDRDFAARFSFLLSIPAILGAVVLNGKDIVRGAETGGAALIAGAASAAIAGVFAVRLMIKIIREKSLWGFAVYTAVLGLLVIVDQFGTHFFF
jgi:undecaprenyl-diphosphatase